MGGRGSRPIKRQQKIKKYVEELEKNDGLLKETETITTRMEPPQSRFKFTGAASLSDPHDLRLAYMGSNSVVDLDDIAALEINPSTLQYPFENIVLEGGGTKGMAYAGALKCLEELGIMSQIKRIGGTSAGAIVSSLVALGYTADEVLGFLSQDMRSILLDHSCGCFSLIPNVLRTYGWNPGNRVYEWFGKAIKRKTGNADTSFRELFNLRGVELCIVVTNLSLMTAQYCHAKTTPNMPIRDALRMTIAIPGVFAPVIYDNNGATDIFVDGGLIVNYPINCFDGWYLSMAKKDAFLARIESLEDMQMVMDPKHRFESTEPNKTMGFLVFDDSEREIMRFDLERRYGSLIPQTPTKNTKLWRKREAMKTDREMSSKVHNRIVKAVNNLLDVISKSNDSCPEYISKEELLLALNNEAFLPENKELLFGKDTQLVNAFKILDENGNNKIAVWELIHFIEQRGVRMQVRFQGFIRRQVNSIRTFMLALRDTVLTNLMLTTVDEKDFGRTVGINTGHIQTLDYDLEKEDKEFIVQRGYNATMSFLRYFASKYPHEVKARKDQA